jgi:hypothetical protein
MRVALPSSPLASFALVSLALVTACATGVAVDDEDPPNLASRRALPEAPSAAPSSPQGAPEGGAPRDASTARDAATPPEPAAPDAATLGPDAGALQDAATSPDTSTGGSTTQAGPGEVLVTEVMFDPAGSEPNDEWIEVTCVAPDPRSLRGLTLRDGAGRTHTIAADVIVAPGAYVVLARSRASARAQGIADAAIGYEYGAGQASGSGIILANGSTGAIAIARGTTDLVKVPYGSFSLSTGEGQSIELRPGMAPSVAQSAHFCASTGQLGALLATPGRGPSCL